MILPLIGKALPIPALSFLAPIISVEYAGKSIAEREPRQQRARAKAAKSASIGSKEREHKQQRARAKAAKRASKASDGR